MYLTNSRDVGTIPRYSAHKFNLFYSIQFPIISSSVGGFVMTSSNRNISALLSILRGIHRSSWGSMNKVLRLCHAHHEIILRILFMSIFNCKSKLLYLPNYTIFSAWQYPPKCIGNLKSFGIGKEYVLYIWLYIPKSSIDCIQWMTTSRWYFPTKCQLPSHIRFFIFSCLI